MTCTCKEVDKRYRDAGCKCLHYGLHFPDCMCEAQTVSDHSPGPVDDNELLIRSIFSPIHINQETGEIKPAAFSDVKDKGLSVNRKNFISKQDLLRKIEHKLHNDKAAGKNRDGFWRLISTNCGQVRRLLNEKGVRLFCVYDTATPEDRSHADVCQNLGGSSRSTSADKKVRRRIYEAFMDPPVTIDRIYDANK